MNKKSENPNRAQGQKVMFGPTRSSKYPDSEADAIGNSFRTHTKTGEGLADRVAEAVKNKTPFFLSETTPRNRLRQPVDKMYEGFITPAELAKLIEPAKQFFLGRQIMGEYGGMLYWTKNSLGEINYPRMAPAKDLEEARANFFNILKDYGAKERQLGCGPLIGLCSAMIFPPYGSNVFDIFSLEMMPGDPERLSSAIRGTSRAYSKSAFHTLVAHGWYGGGLWDEIYFKRLKNAFNYAYMAGFDGIFSESGHFGFNGYGNKVERSDAQAVEFRQIMKDFREFCDSDRRPWGGPETPMAFMQGNLDGFPGLWASCVWGQFDNPAFASGDAERGWELTQAVYRKRPWFDNMLRGNQDNSGQVPCGLYDIVPADIPLEQLKRYKLLVIPGWNTMTDELYRKLQQYVANGGTLLMTLAQMRSNIRRDEPLKLYKDGDFSELFGVKLSLAKTIRVNGLKFCKTESFDGKLLWPDWTDFCDPKFSESDFMAASIQSSVAVNIAEASNNFDGKLDSDAERVPVLLEHSLGKGKAFLINSVEFAGSKNMFDFCHLVISELMRAAQPAELDVLHSENIRYAKYGKTLYVTNQSYDLDGVFKVNGKSYQLKPQELRRIELD